MDYEILSAELEKDKEITRRQFLKYAGALAGALTLGSCASLQTGTQPIKEEALAKPREFEPSVLWHDGRRQDVDRHIQSRSLPGIDWTASETEPYTEVTPMASGRVAASGYYKIDGNLINIHHGLGFFTIYAHLDKIFVEKNEKVSRNVPIGEAGNTGSGAKRIWHLHNSLIVPSYVKWPVQYLNSKGHVLLTADPEQYGKRSFKLDYWDGTDWDSEFEKVSEEAISYVGNLRKNVTPEMEKEYQEKYVKKMSRVGFNSVDKRIVFIEKKIREGKFPYQDESPEEILKKFEYYKKQRPVLSKPFVNPNLKHLYDCSFKERYYREHGLETK